MGDLVTAFGLVLVIEGLIWALVPGYARRTLEALDEMPEGTVRAVAIAAIVAGVVVVWFVRG
ncbi:MAG: DUF2065 domain-containing protein [Pseudomonadota bacterium]